MKTTKIKIRNLFGIAETELDGSSVEITGKKGTGKTSVIDSIRYALTNASDRDYIVKNGELEGEIIIETDTGLTIGRKKRTDKSDYKSIKEFGKEILKPQEFLNEIFTPLQLDPVAFTQMSRQEQNRTILDLIEFDWDINWIKDKFGEIPQGVDYQQNILQVLYEIQSDKGNYFRERQDINRDVKSKLAMVNDVGKDIPEAYQAEYWEAYNLGEKFKELETIRKDIGIIERAKQFKESFDNKLRGMEAERDIAIVAEEKTIASEKTTLLSNIERMKAEIIAAEDKTKSLSSKLEDKIALVTSQYENKVSKLNSDVEVANKYAGKEIPDTTELAEEITNAEKMKKHLNEYTRMRTYQKEVDVLKVKSDDYTTKIELARELPGEILKTATLPITGLEVKDGIPFINGLPVSNLSDGEKLELCLDVAISKKSNLQIILIDGAEKLDSESRNKLYAKCKEKDLQLIATRTTDSNELEVTVL